MSETAVRRSFSKNPSWDFETHEYHRDTPLPDRKAIVLVAQIPNGEKPDGTSFYEFVEAKFTRHHSALLKSVSEPNIEEKDSHKASFAHLSVSSDSNKRANPFRNWDIYDCIVMTGLFLLTVGLTIPLFAGSRVFSFIFPLGASLVGAGTFLARRHGSAPL